MKIENWLLVPVAAVLTACGGGGGCADAACTAGGGSASPVFVTTASAVSVSIGFDGTLASVNADKSYGKTVAVSVADTNGYAVKGAVVTPKLTLPTYRKGYFQRDAENKVTGYFSLNCPNEDVNANDVLDAGEDLNSDGEISPRKSLVTLSPTTATTDEFGIAYFEVRYFKSHASWIRYRFQADTRVNTTEGTAVQELQTSYIEGDDEIVGAPFIVSPWGSDVSAAGCSNRT